MFTTHDYGREKVSRSHSYEKLAFTHFSCWSELTRAFGHPHYWMSTDVHWPRVLWLGRCERWPLCQQRTILTNHISKTWFPICLLITITSFAIFDLPLLLSRNFHHHSQLPHVQLSFPIPTVRFSYLLSQPTTDQGYFRHSTKVGPPKQVSSIPPPHFVLYICRYELSVRTSHVWTHFCIPFVN